MYHPAKDVEEIVSCQTIDKIHCHYCHYQIDTQPERKQCNDFDGVTPTMINSKTTRPHNSGHNERVERRNFHKYQQFEQSEMMTTDVKSNMYKLGCQFVYGFEDENQSEKPKEDYLDSHETTLDSYTQKEAITVKGKYLSLKEELISNTICKVNQEQFNCEYYKAQLHLNSPYRRQNWKLKNITLQNVVSLMIYCNFDTLQYFFSKTYRDNQGTQHANFYHLGKYLKISIRKFGSNVRS
eukprot:389277_1